MSTTELSQNIELTKKVVKLTRDNAELVNEVQELKQRYIRLQFENNRVVKHCEKIKNMMRKVMTTMLPFISSFEALDIEINNFANIETLLNESDINISLNRSQKCEKSKRQFPSIPPIAVNGHVIYKPTINLQRIPGNIQHQLSHGSEPTDEIQRPIDINLENDENNPQIPEEITDSLCSLTALDGSLNRDLHDVTIEDPPVYQAIEDRNEEISSPNEMPEPVANPEQTSENNSAAFNPALTVISEESSSQLLGFTEYSLIHSTPMVIPNAIKSTEENLCNSPCSSQKNYRKIPVVKLERLKTSEMPKNNNTEIEDCKVVERTNFSVINRNVTARKKRHDVSSDCIVLLDRLSEEEISGSSQSSSNKENIPDKKRDSRKRVSDDCSNGSINDSARRTRRKRDVSYRERKINIKMRRSK